MDDAQIQSWRDGDAMAGAAVRNAVRTIADAVIGTPIGSKARPSFLVQDEARRRETTAEIAREVMQRGGTSVAELRALTMMIAARHLVLSERAGQPDDPTESHLPPQLVVSLALSADSLTSHARESADRHVGSCSRCKEEVAIVQGVVKRLAMPVLPSTRVTPTEEPAGRAPPPRPAAPPPVGPPSAADEPRSPRGERPKASPAPRKAPSPGGPVRPPRGGRLDPQGGVPMWQAALPVLAIVLVLVALVAARGQRQGELLASPDLAGLAVRKPLVPTGADALPAGLESAVLDLQRGDCRLAADRLRNARLRDPSQAAVAWYEGTTHVCAGNGALAMQAFDAYLAAGGQSSPDLLWYQAQAALLQGDAQEARTRLARLRPLAGLERGAEVDRQLAGISQLTR